MSEDEALFIPRGKNRRNKLKNVKKANSTMDHIEKHPGVALQSQNIQSNQRMDAFDEEDSTDESVDCSSGTDKQSDDKDSDDFDSGNESRFHSRIVIIGWTTTDCQSI